MLLIYKMHCYQPQNNMIYMYVLIYLRAHYSFMDDCLDGYIVAACMHLLNLSDSNGEPRRKQPLFDVLPDEEKYRYISKIAREILEKYIKITEGN